MGTNCTEIEWDSSASPVRLRRSLCVLGTAGSRAAPVRRVGDVGWRALSGDAAPPPVKHPSDALRATSTACDDPGAGLEVGDRAELWASHCDTTVNVCSHYLGARRGIVEAI